MKALNNLQSAGSDPVLIQRFPDQNNSTSINPQYLTWLSQFGSAADLVQRISTHIKSRFLNIKVFIPSLSILRKII